MTDRRERIHSDLKYDANGRQIAAFVIDAPLITLLAGVRTAMQANRDFVQNFSGNGVKKEPGVDQACGLSGSNKPN